jgi:hypothetical protein
MLYRIDSRAQLVIFKKSIEVKVFKATYNYYKIKFKAIKRGLVLYTNCTEIY